MRPVQRTHRLTVLLVSAAVFALAAHGAAAEWTLELEGGAAWPTRVDFAIPGDGGSLVRLGDAADSPVAAWRATLTTEVGRGWSLRVLAAPLRTDATFVAAAPVVFRDRVFPAGEPLRARYVFDSYRITAFRHFQTDTSWTFRAGATVKVRDAEISVADGAGRTAKDDLGVVPLLYGGARVRLGPRLALDVEADALAAPQGRAVDATIRGEVAVSDRTTAFVGYRFLDGGADNDEVYTFARFHYAVAGIRIGL